MNLSAMLGGRFGTAGSRVVIEEYPAGIELVSIRHNRRCHHIRSCLKQKTINVLVRVTPAKTPAAWERCHRSPFATPAFMKKVEQKIIIPTIDGTADRRDRLPGFYLLRAYECQRENRTSSSTMPVLGDPES
ncbi:MAG: hypothetical protein MZV63_67545 [Marinilabiliales bacterium]|nr:hypothetical protein [Marinilabiliales bacterium]